MSNVRENVAAINKYRAELEAALEDLTKIDMQVMRKTISAAVREAKEKTPVGKYPSRVEFTTKDGKRVSFAVTKKVGGHLRRNWFFTKVTKTKKGVKTVLYNNVEYAIPVNNGHRVKAKDGRTVGFVKGKHMLEKAVIAAEKTMAGEFKKAVEEVKKKHDL